MIALLHEDDVISNLKLLREKYPSSDIERKVNDILAKCSHMQKGIVGVSLYISDM